MIISFIIYDIKEHVISEVTFSEYFNAFEFVSSMLNFNCFNRYSGHCMLHDTMVYYKKEGYKVKIIVCDPFITNYNFEDICFSFNEEQLKSIKSYKQIQFLKRKTTLDSLSCLSIE